VSIACGALIDGDQYRFVKLLFRFVSQILKSKCVKKQVKVYFTS